MKTKIISKLKKELLIVELPKWYKSFNYQKPLLEVRGDEPNLVEFLSLGRYELLGKPDEIKEEDVAKFVHQSIHTNLFAYYVKDIPVNTYCYKTALDSFNSALESEIYWNVNPLGTEPNHIDYKFEKYKGEYHFKSESHKSRYGNVYEKWQQAEFDTFDKKRTLIFVKN